MTSYHFGVRAVWSGDRSSPAELSERFLRTIEALKPLDPAMTDWALGDSGPDPRQFETIRLADFHGSLADWAARNIACGESGDWLPLDGYSLMGWGSRVPTPIDEPGSVHLSVTAGRSKGDVANFTVNSVDGVFGRPQDKALLTQPIFRGALQALVVNWPCVYATAYAIDLDMPPIPVIRSHADLMRVAAEPDPPPPLFLRWIAYLSAPLVEGFSPPNELISERTPGGGLFLTATSDFLDPKDPVQRRRALRLTAILSALAPEIQDGGVPAGGPPMRVGSY